MSEPRQAVVLSYASQDAKVAKRLCEARASSCPLTNYNFQCEPVNRTGLGAGLKALANVAKADHEDRQLQFTARGQPFGPLQHAKAWAAEGVEDVDATPRRVGMQVVGDVPRVEFAPVTGVSEVKSGSQRLALEESISASSLPLRALCVQGLSSGL